ncbi:hypothetical protein [Prosthecobacter sp.]|uniref:hypothetical protein n=1 Tax=Prosthecobacter sp. TaxID=1965333 RepID=UPI0037843A58
MPASEDQIYTYRVTRKIQTGGSGCSASFCFLIGVAIMIFVPWIIGVPAGLIIILISFAFQPKYALHSSCGHCGNEVAHSSVLCPVCRADMAPEPLTKEPLNTVQYVTIMIAVLGLIGFAIIYWAGTSR